MPDTIVREATPADVQAIAALYAEEVSERVNTYEYDAPDASEMLRRMQRILADGYPYLVAEHHGRFAGYAYAGGFRVRAAYRPTVENSVYVHPGCAGKGVGSALMQRLIDECTARGFRQMIAVIGEPANTASVRLHERFGFEHVGTFNGIAWKHERWLDTMFMQRALGNGNTNAPDSPTANGTLP